MYAPVLGNATGIIPGMYMFLLSPYFLCTTKKTTINSGIINSIQARMDFLRYCISRPTTCLWNIYEACVRRQIQYIATLEFLLQIS